MGGTRASSFAAGRHGKSAVLSWLRRQLGDSTVPAAVTIDPGQWQAQRQHLLCAIGQLGPAPYAVRSDAADEDQPGRSMAGHYRSELNVQAADLGLAIDRVLAAQSESQRPGVMVQSMVRNYRWVVVASTHRVADAAPWYCIELAEGDSALVTSGRANGRQLAVHRQAWSDGQSDLSALPAEWRAPCVAVLNTLQSVEAAWAETVPRPLSRQPVLECEMLLCPSSGMQTLQVKLLQARAVLPTRSDRSAQCATAPRAAAPSSLPGRLPDFFAVDRQPAVLGQRRLLSLMADWNPAELLGSHPRPLALGLFRHSIADGPWWRARGDLGYRPPPGPRVSLLQPLDGRPFVDVRRSANSLLPATLPDAIGCRLIDHWLQRLQETPVLHDKVEFEVFTTAIDFDRSSFERAADEARLNREQRDCWMALLRQLTGNLLRKQQIEERRAALLRLLECKAAQQDPPLSWHLARCRRAGLLFAGLARLAFVAEAQLRSAQRCSVLRQERTHALRQAAGNMRELLDSLPSAERTQFRVGSFEVSHPRWQTLSQPSHKAPECRPSDFVLTDGERVEVNRALTECGLDTACHGLAADDWARFVQRAIESREWGKFMFSRCIAGALTSIEHLGNRLNLSLDELSHLPLPHLVRAARSTRPDPTLRQAAAAGADRHRHQQQRLLSPVLRSPADRFVSDSLAALPNFVGTRVVKSSLIRLDQQPQSADRLRGKIVAIRAADPGYDWIFQCGIAGLVTAWGGANSHMAVRCVELDLPAAIGCGEAVFDRLLDGSQLLLDPLGRQLDSR